MQAQHIFEVEVGQDVSVQDHESLAGVQGRLYILYRAARIERLGLVDVGKFHTEVRAVTVCLLEAFRAVGHSQHHISDAEFTQREEYMVQEGPVDQRDKRLRHCFGQRAQPRTLPANQYCCFHL